jgi:WD40 repeat protein
MSMRLIRALSGGAFAAVVGLALAQQPMPAPYPPINPAAARADGVGGGLDSAGLAIVYLDGQGLLVAACDDGTVTYWSADVALGVRSAESAPPPFEAHTGPVTSVVALGATFATGGADGKVHVWDLRTGKATQTLAVGGPVRAMAAAPDGKALAVAAGEEPAIHLWGADGKAGLKLIGPKDWLLAVAFSPDGQQVAAGGFDGRWYLWETATGKKLIDAEAHAPPPPNTPARDANPVTALAFAPDGKALAVGGADGQVLLFQTDGKFVRPMVGGHGSAVSGLAFHPTGALLASSGKDRVVRLWSPANGQALKALEGHTAWAMGLTFLARGTRLASVGADQSVRLWDLTEPKK